jgi:hypothetical protein
MYDLLNVIVKLYSETPMMHRNLWELSYSRRQYPSTSFSTDSTETVEYSPQHDEGCRRAVIQYCMPI